MSVHWEWDHKKGHDVIVPDDPPVVETTSMSDYKKLVGKVVAGVEQEALSLTVVFTDGTRLVIEAGAETFGAGEWMTVEFKDRCS